MKREEDLTWTGQCSELGRDLAGLSSTFVSKESALQGVRTWVLSMRPNADIVEVLVPLSEKAMQVLDTLVLGIIAKFKNEGGTPGTRIPRYVIAKTTLDENERELWSGEYIERTATGFYVTKLGLMARSGIHRQDENADIYFG